MEKREPDKDFLNAVSAIQKIMNNNHISIHDISAFLSSEVMIPVSIFNSSLSPLGSLVAYLKFFKGLTCTEIAKTLNRDARTIWLTLKKNKNIKDIKEDFTITVPVGIFSQRSHSIMENLVYELKNIKGLRFVDIAKITGKNQKTIWCFYKRAEKKWE